MDVEGGQWFLCVVHMDFCLGLSIWKIILTFFFLNSR